MKSSVETTKGFYENAYSRAETKTGVLLVLGIFAGVYSALGCFGAQIASAYGANRIVSSVIFPVGSMLTTCCGGTLFTGNLLMLIGYKKNRITLKQLLRYLSLAYVSNFAGSLLLVVLICLSGYTDGAIREVMIATAENKLANSFVQSLCKGVLCGILVNLGAWLSYAGNSMQGKILGVFFPTMLFYLCGFEHCITNMYFIPMAMLLGCRISLGAFLYNLLAVTIGNVLGGGFFVALGYWYVFVKEAKE